MNVRERVREARSGRSARDSGWALVNEVATLVAMTLSFVLLARQLGAEDYGNYQGVFALSAVASAFTNSGVTLAIYEHAVRESEDLRTVARSCFSIATAFGLVAAVILFALSFWLVPGMPAHITALILVAELVLAGWTQTSAAVVQAAVGFGAATRMRVTVSVSRAVILAVLAGVGQLTLPVYALTYGVALGLLGVANAAVAGRVVGDPTLTPGRISWDHVKSTFTYSIGISAVNVQNDGDKVALTASSHVTDAGRYGAAYRIVQLGMMPVNALAAATHLSFLDPDRSPDDVVARSRRFAVLAFGYGLAFAAVLFVAAPAVPWVLGDDFEGTETMIRVILPLVALKSLGMFPMNGLLGFGRNRLRTAILVGNAAFAVGLYAALVPPWSWKGAAAATAISEASLAAVAWTALLRERRRHVRRHQQMEVATA